MTAPQPHNAHLRFHVPAVRHLAWMCQAPQLINAPIAFDIEPWLSDSVWQTLTHWDRSPEDGPDLLTQPAARRLGHYFEALYECLLQDLLGWEILLKNQPIRNNGVTLGELDFVVRNPRDGAIEHHEIAVKFYLGHQRSAAESPLWYGPNSRDRLDLKTDRLLTHQGRLTEKPETRTLLASLGLAVPAKARLFMPGYLFYPVNRSLSPPPTAPANHLRGQWLSIGQLDAQDTGGLPAPAGNAGKRWVPLDKPHWLGPWIQQHSPDPMHAEEALETVRLNGIPRLFAVLQPTAGEYVWREAERVFVVPDTWPD